MSDSKPDTPDKGSAEAALPYRVLARKYRPSSFEDLLGQDAMVQTLTNAFAAGRIAQAYMLTGVRGVGKTTTARLIARALNYQKPGEEPTPTTQFDGLGVHCEAILQSRHVDVIEMDAASQTSVNNVRDNIIDVIKYAPASAPYKVYIIDEVHMLSKSAFNALLKTLEEPPGHVKFIFATTEINKVPVTILSRCQRFDLRRFDAALLQTHLGNIAKKEGIEVEDDALALLARAAEGSARDGLSLLDQAIAFGGDKVLASDVQAMLGLVDRARIIDLFEAVVTGEAAKALELARDQYDLGARPDAILANLAQFTHWVTRIKVVPKLADDAGHSQVERERGKEFAERLAMATLTRAWQMLLKGMDEVARSHDGIAAAEMVLIRMAYAAQLPTPGDVVRRLQDTKSDGPPATSPASPPTPAKKASPSSSDTALAGPALAVARDQQDKETVAAANAVTLSSFEDMIALAAKMRDIKIKHALENSVRPIALSPGKVEFALEPDAPRDFVGALGRKLQSWTGERWIVMLAREGGEDPIGKRARDAQNSRRRQVESHPLVKQVLSVFPKAEISNVQDLASDIVEPEDI